VELLKIYDFIKDLFDLTPFEIYKFFVEKNDKNTTIANKLNIDCCQTFQTLLYCLSFFKTLGRDLFYNSVIEVLKMENKMIEITGRLHEREFIIKKAGKELDIDIDEILE
jgi:hypothetical protein